MIHECEKRFYKRYPYHHKSNPEYNEECFRLSWCAWVEGWNACAILAEEQTRCTITHK